MDGQLERFEVASRLHAALEKGRFKSEADAEVARECLTRLVGKVRITILGPRPADAVDLANFLVGQQLLTPEAAGRPVRIEEGDETEAMALGRDGKTRTFTGDGIASAFEDSPRSVRIRANLPALAKITVTCASARSATGLQQATVHAATCTDVALWISTEFSELELATWAELPERISDHGYLVAAPRHENLTAMRERATGHFTGLVEIDPVAAMEARSARGGLDKERFKAMGGTAMVQTVKREIALIEQATLDAAQVLLLRLPEVTGPDHARFPAGVAPPSKVAEPRAKTTIEPEHPEAAGETPAEAETGEVFGRRVGRATSYVSAFTPAVPFEDLPDPEPRAEEPPASATRRVLTRPRSVSRMKSRETHRPATPWSLNL